MKKLYFIRHGESEANKNKVFAGRWDIPLTEEGIRQAHRAGKSARELEIDCIVSSPLQRAKHTAEIIADEINYSREKIVISDLFSERDYGDLSGKLWSSVANIDFDMIPNIETTAELIGRADQAVRFLQALKSDNVLLVGHGTAGRAVRSQILGQIKNAVEVPIEDEIPNSQVVEWL
ncbi:MAG TPA: histidine phosphatase family protein [Candidatus Saccharimonadales bacterium]|nr:histidine phosphatase family protein [Candidatus Saccharimonadales bacterium]